MPEQPWWENLDFDFYKRGDSFDLDLGTSLLVGSTAAADVGLRTLAASLLALLCMPAAFSPFHRRREREAAQIYKSMADRGGVDQFFRRPTESVDVHIGSSSWYHFQPEDGSCHTLSFESPFRPVNQDLANRFEMHTRNREARAQYWEHDGDPKPTICVVHGFMADAYWANSRFLGLRWLYEHGYNILLFTLPFHGHRQSNWSPFSGAGYFSGGLSQLNEAVANSIYDLRLFIDYLESTGVEQVGVTGISLGGYTAAALAAVEERLAFCIPNVPVVSIIDLLFQWAPANWVSRSLMSASGIDIQEARHRLAIHSPLSHPPKIDKDRLMIIAGAGDRMAPPKHARLLWEHWDRCEIHWFPGSHMIHLDRGRYLQDMHRFMQEIEFS